MAREKQAPPPRDARVRKTFVGIWWEVFPSEFRCGWVWSKQMWLNALEQNWMTDRSDRVLPFKILKWSSRIEKSKDVVCRVIRSCCHWQDEWAARGLCQRETRAEENSCSEVQPSFRCQFRTEIPSINLCTRSVNIPSTTLAHQSNIVIVCTSSSRHKIPDWQIFQCRAQRWLIGPTAGRKYYIIIAECPTGK